VKGVWNPVQFEGEAIANPTVYGFEGDQLVVGGTSKNRGYLLVRFGVAVEVDAGGTACATNTKRGSLPGELWNLYFYYEALLVPGLVGFLIFVLFKVTLLAVVEIVRVVVFSFADALLVLLGL
jgi:hypothetical protein